MALVVATVSEHCNAGFVCELPEAFEELLRSEEAPHLQLARDALGRETTSDLSEMKLLMTLMRDGDLFVATNYVRPQEDALVRIHVLSQAEGERSTLAAVIAPLILEYATCLELGPAIEHEAIVRSALEQVHVSYTPQVRNSPFAHLVTQAGSKELVHQRDARPEDLTTGTATSTFVAGYCTVDGASDASVGEAIIYHVRISTTAEALVRTDEDRGVRVVKPFQVAIGRQIQAAMHCHGATIQDVYKENWQTLRDGDVAHWYFKVIPSSTGDHHLSLYLRIRDDDGRDAFVFEAKAGSLSVSGSLLRVASANWQYLVSTLALPLAIFIFVSSKKRRRAARIAELRKPKIIEAS